MHRTIQASRKPSNLKKHLVEVEPKLLRKALRFTSNLPGDLYTPAECIEQVEYFTQQIQKKFDSEYGPDIHNERLEILEFLYLVEKFLANIFQKFFHYNTKSESNGSESSEEENTADSTQASKLKTIFLHIFYFLKPNEEEQETKQFDMDMVVAEEYIEYYADKYKKLTRKHKFDMPLCKHTDKNKLYNAIETTSNIPAGYYIMAECTQDVEIFAQKLH